jgi:1-acyl-sn-glycerol-3-phosphate acyltransferase
MADLIASALRVGLDRLVRSDLRGVWLRGTLPVGPFVWAANHHSWWDPFVASAVLGRAGRTACLLMDQDNLASFRFARRLGVFGTREPRAGLGYLAAGRDLVVFPEGELRPAGPLGPLANGAAWFATQAGVPLVAVAVRVAVRGHQAPDAYVSVATVAAEPDVALWTKRLAEDLHRMLSTLDDQFSQAHPREPLPGFRSVVTGKRSWDERIAGRAV